MTSKEEQLRSGRDMKCWEIALTTKSSEKMKRLTLKSILQVTFLIKFWYVEIFLNIYFTTLTKFTNIHLREAPMRLVIHPKAVFLSLFELEKHQFAKKKVWWHT